jgi:hypothetical protein
MQTNETRGQENSLTIKCGSFNLTIEAQPPAVVDPTVNQRQVELRHRLQSAFACLEACDSSIRAEVKNLGALIRVDPNQAAEVSLASLDNLRRILNDIEMVIGPVK